VFTVVLDYKESAVESSQQLCAQRDRHHRTCDYSQQCLLEGERAASHASLRSFHYEILAFALFRLGGALVYFTIYLQHGRRRYTKIRRGCEVRRRTLISYLNYQAGHDHTRLLGPPEEHEDSQSLSIRGGSEWWPILTSIGRLNFD
jgi:hypothetical protein